MRIFGSNCDFKRDCSKVPIPNKCVEYCLERILRNASVEEKQLVLGLEENLAIAIFKAYNASTINSFSDLKRRLTTEQADSLVMKFKTINQFQLNYFNAPRDERESIIDELKRMGLNSGDSFPRFD